jgi:hypothetical protein
MAFGVCICNGWASSYTCEQDSCEVQYTDVYVTLQYKHTYIHKVLRYYVLYPYMRRHASCLNLNHRT